MLVCEVYDPGVPSARPSDTVRSVVVKMISRNSAVIPVVEGDGRLVGVIAQQDIMLPMFPNLGDYIHDSIDGRDFEQMESGYADILQKQAADIMTPNPMTVSLYDPVLKAVSSMGLKKLRRIPVVEEGRYMGFVSITDVGKALFFNNGR